MSRYKVIGIPAAPFGALEGLDMRIGAEVDVELDEHDERYLVGAGCLAPMAESFEDPRAEGAEEQRGVAAGEPGEPDEPRPEPPLASEQPRTEEAQQVTEQAESEQQAEPEQRRARRGRRE